MEFIVGKKYKYRAKANPTDPQIYTCEAICHGYVVFSWNIGVRKEVYASQVNPEDYTEVREPREIWVTLYGDGTFGYSYETLALYKRNSREEMATSRGVKFREVLE